MDLVTAGIVAALGEGLKWVANTQVFLRVSLVNVPETRI